MSDWCGSGCRMCGPPLVGRALVIASRKVSGVISKAEFGQRELTIRFGLANCAPMGRPVYFACSSRIQLVCTGRRRFSRRPCAAGKYVALGGYSIWP